MQTAATCQVSKGAHYTWSFPGSITVELDLDAVRRLQSHLEEAHEGLLLGDSGAGALRVIDFQVLSPEEKATLRSSGPPPQGAGRAPVGYFRITRDGVLRLNDDDLALAKSVFPNPDQIILLIQKPDLAPATASIFFWEAGCMFADFAFLEFPFDAARLAEIESASAAKRNAEPSREPRDEALCRAPAGVARRTRPVLIAGTIVGGLILAMFAAAQFLNPGRTGGRSAASASLTPGPRPFGLRVERGDGGGLLLRWDRRAAAVVNAAAGTLVIQDGETPRVIPLYDEQIRGGMLHYSPVGERVEVRLTLEQPGQRSSTESVLVILSGARQGAPRFNETQPRSSVSGRFDGRHTVSPGSGPGGGDRTNTSVSQSLEATVTALPLPPLSQSDGENLNSASPVDVRHPSASSPEYRPPVILSGTLPVAPSAFQGSGFKPETVELTISLDSRGRIQRVDRDAPPRLDALASAAETAVQRWRFKPALMRDQPVSSQLLLKFRFRPLP